MLATEFINILSTFIFFDYEMNQFEEKANFLRLEHKEERRRIQQECDELFTRLNKAIALSDDADVRRIIRAEKARVYRQTRESLFWERRCYRQQMSINNAEYEAARMCCPSKNAARRAAKLLHAYALQSNSENGMSVSFGDNKKADVRFS